MIANDCMDALCRLAGLLFSSWIPGFLGLTPFSVAQGDVGAVYVLVLYLAGRMFMNRAGIAVDCMDCVGCRVIDGLEQFAGLLETCMPDRLVEEVKKGLG